MCGNRGHKGAIGLLGGINLPDWVVTIIDFRNEKIELSYDLSNYNLEKVDKEYDKIDNAISKMVEIYTPYYSNTGLTGSNGGCHLGCPAGISENKG